MKLFAAAALGAFLAFIPVPAAHANGLLSIMAGEVGQSRPKGCPSRWCACYLDKTLKKAGYAQLGSHRARDFARYGKPAKPGQIGSIMVMPSHVGVVAGKCANGRIKLLSGNHNHRVGSGCYNISRAIAWRMPARAAKSSTAARLSRQTGESFSSVLRSAPVSLASSY
jgi:uncharacterized protein (TIGR02594 family)